MGNFTFTSSTAISSPQNKTTTVNSSYALIYQQIGYAAPAVVPIAHARVAQVVDLTNTEQKEASRQQQILLKQKFNQHEKNHKPAMKMPIQQPARRGRCG